MLLKPSLTRPVFRTTFRPCVNPPHVRLFDSNSSPARPSAVITTDPSYTPPAFPPAIHQHENLHFAWLSSRSLIRLTGPDVFPFLQGLITANITKFELPSAALHPIYTTFLNAQGRILNDVFLWRGNEPGQSGDAPWLIDVDTASKGSLLAHLKKHKLRSKVKLENVSDEELRVYQGWINDYKFSLYEGMERPDAGGIEGHHEEGSSEQASSPQPDWILDQSISITDPRPGMGMRWLATAKGTPQEALRQAPVHELRTYPAPSLVPEDEYTVHRMLHGIAEGQNEIIGGSALPQESNMDFFGGIDFRKGCYLGQELTIRTHHTGVVRKRILPVQLEKDYAPVVAGSKGPTYVADPQDHKPGTMNLPPPGSNISKVSSRGRSSGKWLGGVSNIGLALCRLEMMTDIRLTEEATQYDPDQEFKISWDAQPGYEAGEVKMKAFVPQWLRNSIAASLESRRRTSTRDEEQSEVD